MSSPIPANESTLGELRAEYRGAPPKFFLIASSFLVGGGVIGLSATLLGSDNSLAFTGIVLGLILCGPAVYLAVVALQNQGLRIQVFRDGFVEKRGSAVQTVRWDDIQTVFQKITKHDLGITYEFTLNLSSGKRLVYTQRIKDIRDFGSTVQDEVTTRKLSAALEAVNKRHTLAFGKLTLGKDGVSKGRQEVFWRDIDKVFVNNGVINIKPKGADLGTGWPTQPIAETPNAFVLLKLLEHKVGTQR